MRFKWGRTTEKEPLPIPLGDLGATLVPALQTSHPVENVLLLASGCRHH
jgi:hypothetical protein